MSPHLMIVLYAVIALVVVLWILHSFIPLPKFIKSILSLVIILFVIYWLLTKFGIVHGPMVNNFMMRIKTII